MVRRSVVAARCRVSRCSPERVSFLSACGCCSCPHAWGCYPLVLWPYVGVLPTRAVSMCGDATHPCCVHVWGCYPPVLLVIVCVWGCYPPVLCPCVGMLPTRAVGDCLCVGMLPTRAVGDCLCVVFVRVVLVGGRGSVM
jgi:hypothetical protein